MGRTSTGVMGIRPGEGDFLVSLEVVESEHQLLVISENGIGKRTPFEDYPTRGRGGKGVITMKVTEKTGKVISAVKVNEGDELMLMTNAGQSVRIKAAEARLAGRNTSGVILMKTKQGELIQDVALVVSDDDLAGDGEESESEESAE